MYVTTLRTGATCSRGVTATILYKYQGDTHLDAGNHIGHTREAYICSVLKLYNSFWILIFTPMMLLFILTNVGYLFVLAIATTWQQTPELVCPFEGMTAHLPWRYTLEAGETFYLVRWYQGKPVGPQIAEYQFSSNTFTPNYPYDAPGKLVFDNMTRDHNVGITMNNVALSDSSQYSVTLQPVADNTNGFLRVLQGDIMFCASKGSTRSCGPFVALGDSGGWTFTWNLTDQTPGTELTMDITVDYEGRHTRFCSHVTACILAVEVSEDVVLEASVSLRVNGTACYQMTRSYVVELPLQPTAPSTTASDTTIAGSYQDTTSTPTSIATYPISTPSNSYLLSAGGLAGIVVVLVISFLGNVILFILYWKKHGEQKKKEGATPLTPPGPYQNMATYVNGGGAGSGDGEVLQSLETVSEPYDNVNSEVFRVPTSAGHQPIDASGQYECMDMTTREPRDQPADTSGQYERIHMATREPDDPTNRVYLVLQQ